MSRFQPFHKLHLLHLNTLTQITVYVITVKDVLMSPARVKTPTTGALEAGTERTCFARGESLVAEYVKQEYAYSTDMASKSFC